MTRGRPTKDESEKTQYIPIPIKNKDKDELDKYIEDIGLGGMNKEFYRASLLSSTSATQYLDFETRARTLESQIQQTKERHARDRAKLEQDIIDLDKDFNEDIKNLESQLALALANVKAIQRFGETPDKALTNAKDGLKPIVQADKERIQATIEQTRISNQSTTDAMKLYEYENPNGFTRQLYALNKMIQDNYGSSRYSTYTPDEIIQERWNDLIQTAKAINWDNIPARNIRESIGFLEKDHTRDYEQSRVIIEIIKQSRQLEG